MACTIRGKCFLGLLDPILAHPGDVVLYNEPFAVKMRRGTESNRIEMMMVGADQPPVFCSQSITFIVPSSKNRNE